MSKQTRYDKVKLLGVEVDAFTNRDAALYICDLAQEGTRSAYVIKPYVEFLDRADRSTEIRKLLNEAELSLADGVALIWAAHYLYAGPRSTGRFWGTLFQIVLAPDKLTWPLPERASGINFTWPLLHEAGRRRLRVYLIGKASAAEIEAVGRVVERKAEGITIAGTRPGFDPHAKAGRVTDEWLQDAAASVKAAEADLILVGMGFPLQERVCAYLADHLHHGVFVGEGGTFDYDSFGGPRRKAPAWMQRSGLEWLWRLILEPSRLGRQLAIPRFIYRIWQTRRP
jgi:N-acetylglucosaminyldiphosphoundecaprenol N-acetyl-beta-D-mannosaminyltransferase